MRGYIALISVLIISALLLLIGLSTSHFGISQLSMGLQRSQTQESSWLAQACAEEALMKLVESDFEYQGNETLNINGETCTILPIEKTGGKSQVIKVTSSAYNQTKKIKIEIKENKIESWQEVADF